MRQPGRQLSDTATDAHAVTADNIVAVGTIIGSLIGVITLLLRLLVVSKNQHIKTLEDEIGHLRNEVTLLRDLSLTGRHRREDD